MSPPRTLLAFLATLAVLPLAGAQADAEAAFTSTSVEWTGSPESLGLLVALQNILPRNSDPLQPTAAPPVEDSFYSIEAANMLVRIDSADAYAETPGFFLVVPPTIGPASSPAVDSTEATYHEAAVVGTASRPDRALYVFPLDGCEAVVMTSDATAEPSPIPESKAISHFGNERSISRDVSAAVQVTPAPGTTITVTGCFLVVLWEWDAEWTASEGGGTFSSGKADSQGASDPTGATGAEATVSNAQQVYFFVPDGTFTIGSTDGRPSLAYVESAHVQATHFTLHEATGTLQAADGPLDVAGRDVELHGELDAVLTRNGDRIASRLGGSLDSADVDGAAVPLASTAARPAPKWPWLLGAIGIVAVPVLAMPLLRRRHATPPVVVEPDPEPAELMARAEALLGRLRPNEAQVLTEALLLRSPDDPEVHRNHAVALTMLKRQRAALRHRLRAEALLRQSGDRYLLGENLFDLARLCLGLGREDPSNGERWIRRSLGSLNEALAMRPDLREEVCLHPEFADLTDRLGAAREPVDADPFDWVRP